MLQRRLALFAGFVDRAIDFFQLAARRVVHDLRPGFIGFAQSHGVGVARPAIAPQGLVGQFGDVRSAHHDLHSGRANGVGDAVGLRDHAGHGADADQIDLLVADVLRDLSLVHGLRVAVDQQHFMSGRSQRLEQKHPEMRHEIAGDPVVGVIKQNSHDCSLLSESSSIRASPHGSSHERCQELAFYLSFR